MAAKRPASPIDARFAKVYRDATWRVRDNGSLSGARSMEAVGDMDAPGFGDLIPPAEVGGPLTHALLLKRPLRVTEAAPRRPPATRDAGRKLASEHGGCTSSSRTRTSRSTSRPR